MGLKSRVKRFEKMVAIAKVRWVEKLFFFFCQTSACVWCTQLRQILRERNNFSTMMAFLGGMNNSAVARLKWTRASLSKKPSEVRQLSLSAK